MRIKLKTNSIRAKIVGLLLMFIVPLILLLITYNFYSISVLRKETAKSNKNTLSLYTDDIDNRLEKINFFLLDIMLTNASYNVLRKSSTDLQVLLATHEIVAKLTSGLNFNENIDMFFIHSELNDVKREVYKERFGANYSFSEKANIRYEIEQLTSDGSNLGTKKWFPVKIDDKYYLFRIFGSKGTYIGGVIKVENMIFPLSKMARNENSIMLYNTADGEPLNNQTIIQDNKITLRDDDKAYYLSGMPKRYIVLSEKLVMSDINMTALIPDTSIFIGLSSMQILLLVISLLTLLIIPISIMIIRKTIIMPLNMLVDTINNVKEGNWDVKMNTPFASDEFILVNDTFNSMIEVIKTLKIIAYEEKIEKQKAQLQHLIFQIKPHFFLNALKNIYGMAESRNYSIIQEMILGLSNHFRYIFEDEDELVVLKDEVNYVKNYLNIQGLSIASPPECTIDIDERLVNFLIPPVSIQTFVENSLKHGMAPDRVLKITIKVILLPSDEGNFADIIVTDNGSGFQETVLEELNFGQGLRNSREKVGIRNIKKRLALVFGENAQVVFSNAVNGGAVSEMLIPIENAFLERGETN